MMRNSILLAAFLLLAGCASLAPPPPPPPPVATPSVDATSLVISINAPASEVRSTVVGRARARGTAARLTDPRTIVLERALQETPEALAELCGPHQQGRIVRIVLTTAQSGAVTQLTERRFVVDGANSCAVVLAGADREAGMRSLEELKAQVESRGIVR